MDIEPWIESDGRWVVKVHGKRLKNRAGKDRKFQTKAAAQRAGEQHLRICRKVAGLQESPHVGHR